MKTSKLLLVLLLCILTYGNNFTFGQDVEFELVGRHPYGTCEAIAVQGNYSYIFNGAAFEVIDISDPSNPSVVGMCTLPTHGQQILINGDYAYLSIYFNGIRVIDISDPTNPEEISYSNPIPAPGAMLIDGNLLLLADLNGNFSFLDISNPNNSDTFMQQLSQCSYSNNQDFGYALSIQTYGDNAFVSAADRGIFTVNIVDVYNPYPVANYFEEGKIFTDMTIKYPYLFTNDGAYGFRILDISDPSNWFEISNIQIDQGPKGLIIKDEKAYVGFWNGINVIDISDPTNPIKENSQTYQEYYALMGMTLSNNGFLHIAGGLGGYFIIEIQADNNLELASHYVTGIQGAVIEIIGNYAYIGGGSGPEGQNNLRILDISDPYNPIQAGVWSTPRNIGIFEIQKHGQYLYVFAGDILILDISNPLQPELIGKTNRFGGTYRKFLADGNRAYTLDWSAGMDIWDISDPASPFHIKTLPLTGLPSSFPGPYGLTSTADYVYATDSKNGIHVIDKITMSEVEMVTIEGVLDCSIYENKLYLPGAYSFGGLKIYNIDNPALPVEIPGGEFNYGGMIHNIHIGDYFITKENHGIAAINVSNLPFPNSPSLDGLFPFPMQVDDMTSSGEYVFTINKSDGVFVFKTNIVPDDPDREALIAMYNSLNGDNWNNNTNWCTDAPLEEWYGIDTDGNNVTRIILQDNNLQGSINFQIGNLSSLAYLDLSNNQISGQIPYEIGNCSELVELWLVENQIDGQLPSELGNCNKLWGLYLGNNNISGNIPDSFKDLPQLQQLDLNYNSLTGTIPDWLGNMTTLNDLHLCGNHFTGTIPSELFNNQIRFLNLALNNLEGSVPSNIGNAVEMTNLVLYKNNLIGDIPENISNLIKLVEFDISNNTFEGNLPIEMCQFPDLETFKIEYNNYGAENCDLINCLSQKDLIAHSHSPQKTGFDFHSDCGQDIVQGVIRQDYEAMVALYDNCNGINWTTKIGWEIKDIPVGEWTGVVVEDYRVTEIALGNNNLTGELPDQFFDLTNLTRIQFQENNLVGMISPLIEQFQNLEWLYLYGNQLSGDIPSIFANLTQLENLSLHQNDLSGEIGPMLTNMMNLKQIEIFDNNFSGLILEYLSNKTSMEIISLGYNNFSGSIPTQTENWSNLTHFDIPNNNFNGILPENIYDLTNLTHLVIWGNSIIGTISDKIGNLINLQNFEIGGGNSFSGIVPDEIGNCLNLIYLKFDQNEFIDPLPMSICNLPKLVEMHLYLNNFDAGSCETIQCLKNKPGLSVNSWDQKTGFNFDTDCDSNELFLLADYPFITDANDISGNNLHGIVNGAQLVPNYCGTTDGGYVFDSNENYIEFPSEPLKNLQSGSIELIINIDHLNSDHWFFCYGLDTGYGLSVCIDASGAFCFQKGGIYRGNPGKIRTGEWIHLALTWDGTKIRTYVNGELDIEVDNNGYPEIGSEPIVIGADTYHRPQYSYPGIIDLVRIYDGVLEQSEIQNLSIERPECGGSGGNLTIAGNYSGTWCQAVTISDNYAYIGNGDYLEILDITIPSSPTLIGRVNLIGTETNFELTQPIRDIIIQDDLVFVAKAGDGVRVVDISNPSTPVEVASYYNCEINGISVENNYLFFANCMMEFYVMQLMPDNSLVEISMIQLEEPGNPRNVPMNIKLNGNKVYVPGRHGGGMFIVDISDLNNPIKCGNYVSVGLGIFDMEFNQDELFVVEDIKGFSRIDYTDPCNLIPLPNADYIIGDMCYGISVQKEYALVSNWGQFCAIDLTTKEITSSISTGGEATEVDTYGEYAFVANGPSGLLIVNISDFSNFDSDLVLHLSAESGFIDLARGNIVNNMEGVSIVSTPWGGSAFEFTGANFIEIPDIDNSLDLIGNFTIEFIAKSTEASNGVLFSKGGYDIYPKNLTLGYGAAPTHYGHFWGVGGGTANLTNFDLHQWKKHIFICNGNEILYIVGDQIQTQGDFAEIQQDLTNELNDEPLRIGEGFSTAPGQWGAQFFTGQIGEIKVYNRALELSEIEEFTFFDPTDFPPDPPIYFEGVAGDQLVSLSWGANFNSDLAGFNIYFSNNEQVFTHLTYLDQTQFFYSHQGLINGSEYFYYITAVDQAGNESGYLNIVSAIPRQSVFDMDYCQDVNNLPSYTNPLDQYGWEASYPANLSVYIVNYWTTFDNSKAIYLRNREIVDGVRIPIYLKSPGINVSGENPVITWNEVAYSIANQSGSKISPRNLYISTDGINFSMVDSYLTSEMPDSYEGDCWRTMEYSLSAYIGKTIWWKWELESVNNEYTYWVIDNVCFSEKSFDPVIVQSGVGEFGQTMSFFQLQRSFNLLNEGYGSVEVNSVEITGDEGFNIINHPEFPVYFVGRKGTDGEGCSGSFNLDVEFSPNSTGDFNANLLIHTNLGAFEFYLHGQGFGCEDSNPAEIGENWSPSQNTVWSYTAQTNELVSISSCHPSNTTDPYQYSYDTYLYVYRSCEDGSLIAENDDLGWENCEYNRASSGVTVVVPAGETIYITWPLLFPRAAHAEDGFIFTVYAEEYIPRDVYVDINSTAPEELGTVENPYRSMNQAFDDLLTLDNIWVSGGRYYGNWEISNQEFNIIGSCNPTTWEQDYENQPTIFDGNEVGYVLHLSQCSGSIDGIIIENGVGVNEQGAGMILGQCEITISNSQFRNNHNSEGDENQWAAGGILIWSGNNKLANCQFYNNSALGGADAIRAGEGILDIQNCLIWEENGNYAVHLNHMEGGEIINNTIYRNNNGFRGLIMFNYSPMEVSNLIAIGGLTENEGDPQAEIIFSLTENEIPGIGNRTIDNPSRSWLFENVDEGNFYLTICSQAHDSGNPDSKYNDVDGSTNDMGCYGGPNGINYIHVKCKPVLPWAKYKVEGDYVLLGYSLVWSSDPTHVDLVRNGIVIGQHTWDSYRPPEGIYDYDIEHGYEYCYKFVMHYSDNEFTESEEICVYIPSCSEAIPAVIGENYSPHQNIWFEFTATNYGIIYVHSCHENQQVEPGQYAFDTYLKVFDDCGGQLIAENDDLEWNNCSYNRASAGVKFPVEPGQTYKIFWENRWYNANTDFDFYFNIEKLPLPEPVPYFDAVYNIVQVGEPVKFLDHTDGYPISWDWTFEGAENTTSNVQNPQGIVYSTPGLYAVNLIISDGIHTEEVSRDNYIMVLDGEFIGEEIWMEDFDWNTNGIPDDWVIEDFTGEERNWIYTKESLITPERSYEPAPFTTVYNGFICYPAFVNTYDFEAGRYIPRINHDAIIQLPLMNFVDFSEVVIEFQDLFRWWSNPPNDIQVKMEVSNDLGQTWTSYDLLREIVQAQWSADPYENISVNITESAALSPEVYIRFRWGGSRFYFWMIDDMKIRAIPANNPPIANAGEDLILDATSLLNTEVSLDASLSTDPDEDQLSYTWKEGEVIIAGPTTDVITTVNLVLGIHNLQLTVDDGNGEIDTDDLRITIIDTEAPEIIHPESVIVGNDPGVCSAYVYFDVTALDNCDSDVDIVVSPPSGTLFLNGETTVECTAVDDAGNVSTSSFVVIVIDIESPVLEVVTDPITLWPVNHKYKTINLDQLVLDVSDNCGIGEEGVVITMVSSDEPEDAKGGGDGKTTDDIIISADCTSVDLRAERQGGSNGRVYTINLSVRDEAGNETTAQCYVHVPHSVKGIAIDDGVGSGYNVESNCSGGFKDGIISDQNKLQIANELQFICFPNPFREETILQYTVPVETRVILEIYSIDGKKINILVNRQEKAGSYSIKWKGRDNSDLPLPNGIYLARIFAGNNKQTVRIVLQR